MAFWQDLGIDKVLNRALRSSRQDLDAEALIRVIVFYRLCVPDSKLDCLHWLKTVAMPAILGTITHQHLLQAMEALMDHPDVVEESFARQIRPLVDHATLTAVFYDLTTVGLHGEGNDNSDLGAYGMNKEIGKPARQFMLGVVQTTEGLPLMHTVHSGNVSRTRTPQAMVQTVLKRFTVQRVILVADRSPLSL